MSISEWLDGIKAGYGDRFTASIVAIGCEDQDDIANIGPEEFVELDSNLLRAGAKTMHLKNIKTAISSLSTAAMATHISNQIYPTT